MVTKRELLEQAARGEGCLGKAGDDDEVFLLVDKDMFAADLVRDWANKVEMYSESTPSRQEKVRDARLVAERMEARESRKAPD